MTQLRERQQVGLVPPPLRAGHSFEWLLGILGIVVGGVGGYIHFSAPLNTIQVLGWESPVGAVADWWGYALQVAGALLVFSSLAILARKTFNRSGYGTLSVWTAALVATVSFFYALTFAILWMQSAA